jgi:cleavage and polyadenylation specificity factor subunit 4
LPGPPPPVEEVVQKIQQLNSYNGVTSNKNFQQRNAGFSQQIEKSPNTIIKPSGTESANVQQQQQQQQQTQTPHLTNGQHQQPQQPNPLNRIATPLPQGISRCVQSSEVLY